MSQLFQGCRRLWIAPSCHSIRPKPITQHDCANCGGRKWGASRLKPQSSGPIFASAALKQNESTLYSSSEDPITEFGFSRAFSERFDLGDKLGSGTFGVVRVATDKQTGERFAVKTMPKRFGPSGHLEHHYVRRVRNEVDIADHLGRSLNVCYLYAAYEDDSCVDLVLELCVGGQLWDRILKGRYTEQQAAHLVREVLQTVAQCHAKNVLMRDIKPENFLFLGPEETSPLKAIDFGISVFCQPGQYIQHRAGTPIYLAPEVVRQHYSLPADLWSAGILAYQLLTGRLPFAGEEGLEVSELYMTKQVYNNKDVFRAILYAELDFQMPPWDTLSEEAKDFVQSLLSRDAALRPSAEEALQHRWLQMADPVGSVAPLSDTIVQRLQRFGTYGRLKQVALRTVAHGIASDSALIADLRSLFRELDPQDTGRVPYAEMQQALQDGRFDLTPSETQQLMAQIDIDESGDIVFDEWIASLVDWRKFQDSEEWDALVSKAFDALDADHSGRIGLNDLELLLCGEDGCEIPDTVDAALREADINHDGGIDLPEFKRLLESQPQDRLDFFESRLADGGSGSEEA